MKRIFLSLPILSLAVLNAQAMNRFEALKTGSADLYNQVINYTNTTAARVADTLKAEAHVAAQEPVIKAVIDRSSGAYAAVHGYVSQAAQAVYGLPAYLVAAKDVAVTYAGTVQQTARDNKYTVAIAGLLAGSYGVYKLYNYMNQPKAQ